MKKSSEIEKDFKIQKLSLFYRFFCWCSGARLYILKKCPSELNKYFGIGIIIFLTGIMAAISGAYAINTIFHSSAIALFFGIFWGVLIFFLDWYLVSSLKKEGKIVKELVYSFPRIVLAVFLAIVISRPLELKLFEKEINQEIEHKKRQNSIDYQKLVDKEFKEIEELKNENESLFQEIKDKENKRNELFNLIIAEAEGKSPTGIAGKGPVYREKKMEYDKIEDELKSLRKMNMAQIESNNKTIERLKEQRYQQIEQGKQASQNYDGFLARLEAHSSLTKKNKAIRFASWFIILLFVSIESAPVMVKLLTNRGPYDQMLEAEEYAIKMQSEKAKFNLESETASHRNNLSDKNELQLEAELRSNQEYIAEIAKARAEINRRKIEKWKQRELKLLDDNAEEYIESIDKMIKSQEAGDIPEFLIYPDDYTKEKT